MVFRTQCWVRSVSSNRPSSRTTRPRGALVGLFSSSSLGGALLGLIAKSVVVVEKSLDDDDDDDDDDARFKVSKMCVKKGSKIRFPIVVVVVVVVVVGIGIVFNTSYLRTNALPRSVPTVD